MENIEKNIKDISKLAKSKYDNKEMKKSKVNPSDMIKKVINKKNMEEDYCDLYGCESGFFTRDDLNELIDDINEKCPEGLSAVEAYIGNDDRTLEVVFDWDEYGQDSVYKKIDFRQIKNPSSLKRFSDELIQMGKDKLGYVNDSHLECYAGITDESLCESSSGSKEEIEADLKSWTDNYTKKQGTLTAWDEETRDIVREILRDNGYRAEVSDGRMSADEDPSYVFAYYKEDKKQKRESLKEGKDSEIEKLARELAQFAYDYDYYGFVDAVDSGEGSDEAITRVAEDNISLLKDGDQGITDWLNEIIEDDYDEESVNKAKEFLDRVNALRDGWDRWEVEPSRDDWDEEESLKEESWDEHGDGTPRISFDDEEEEEDDWLDSYVKNYDKFEPTIGSFDKKEESLKESVDPKKFYQFIIDKKGNPSVKDFMSLGFSEGQATEMVIRMSSTGAEKTLNAARRLLNKLELENESLKESQEWKYQDQDYFEVEIGVLLPESDHEYDAYKITDVYGGKYSFYDTNQYAIFADDFEKEKEYIKNWVTDGDKSEQRYGIIKGKFNDSFDDIDELDVSYFHYDLDDVIFSICRDSNGNIVEDFLKKDVEESLKEGTVIGYSDYVDKIYQNTNLNRAEIWRIARDYWNKSVSAEEVIKKLNEDPKMIYR